MKIFVVSYYFAGESNMGATRIRRLVKYWVQSGDEVAVLTHECGRVLPEAEAAGAERIPVRALDLPELADRVRGWIGKRCPEKCVGETAGIGGLVSKSSRLTGLIHRLFCVPDKFRPWYGPGVQAGRKWIKENSPDLIFVSIEPRTDALIAAKLAKQFSIPLVVEYRDLWNSNPYLHAQAPTPIHQWIQERMENKVLDSASAVVAVTNGMANVLRSRCGGRPVEVLPNFFDRSEYPLPISATRTKEKPFRIVYVGQLYGEREPYAFLEGFHQFIQRNNLSPDDVVFEWAGLVSGQGGVAGWIKDRSLQAYIRYHGMLSHTAALGLLQRAHVALVLVAPDDTIHVPGKLYEAMGACTPVLLMAPAESEAVRILEETGSGLHAECDAKTVAVRLEYIHSQFYREAKREFCGEGRAEYSALVVQARCLGILRSC